MRLSQTRRRPELIRPGDCPLLTGAKRILILRRDEIGDVVLTTPFFRELRKSVPDAFVAVVTKPGPNQLLRAAPWFDLAMPFAPSGRGLRGLLSLMQFANSSLRPKAFDIAIVPRFDVDAHHAALLARWSGAPVRIGFAEAGLPEGQRPDRGRDRLFTHVYHAPISWHEVVKALSLLQAIGGRVEHTTTEVIVTESDRREARRVFDFESLRTLAIGIGARDSKRVWPPARYEALIGRLRQRWPGVALALVGGPEERSLGDQLAGNHANVFSAAGRLTLPATAALLSGCRAYVGPDSGLAHVAAAVRSAVVVVSCHPEGGDDRSPHSPARYGPWKVPNRFLQPPPASMACARFTCRSLKPHCILNVSVESVVKSLGELDVLS